MLLGFKVRFTDPIIDGTKIFTLRDDRKVTPEPGETIYMYSDLRKKNCKMIADNFKLNGTQKVKLFITRKKNILQISIYVDGRKLSLREVGKFVILDGFIDQYDFADYWINNSYATKKAPVDVCIYESKTIYHWTDFRF